MASELAVPEVSPPLLIQPALPTALLEPVAVPTELVLVYVPALAPIELVKDTALALYPEVVPTVLPK